jgi:hypothetical protein
VYQLNLTIASFSRYGVFVINFVDYMYLGLAELFWPRGAGSFGSQIVEAEAVRSARSRGD